MAQQLLDSDVYIHQSRINDKPAFTGAGFNWHSDFETWHSEDGMSPQALLQSVHPVEREQSVQRPLILIPGSHRWFVPTGSKTPEDYWKARLRSYLTTGREAGKEFGVHPCLPTTRPHG